MTKEGASGVQADEWELDVGHDDDEVVLEREDAPEPAANEIDDPDNAAFAALFDMPASERVVIARNRVSLGLEDFDRVIVQGANRLGVEVVQILRTLTIEPRVFVDEVRAKWGKSLAGLDIAGLTDTVAKCEGASCVIARSLPAVAVRRTRARSSAQMVAEMEALGVSRVSWRSLAVGFPDAGSKFGLACPPQRILDQRDAIETAWSQLRDAKARRALHLAVEQRLTGFVSAHPASLSGIEDPPADGLLARDRGRFRLGIDPDPQADFCDYVEIGAGAGHGLREFVERVGPRFGRAFVCEANVPRRRRLKAVIDELANECGAQVVMWPQSEGFEYDAGRCQQLAAALQTWSREGPDHHATHVVIDTGGYELRVLEALSEWLRLVNPIACVSASLAPGGPWRIVNRLAHDCGSRDIDLMTDPFEPEQVICRTFER